MGEDRTVTERLTVSEAAEALGISTEAVRMRIRRGTLRTERDEGTVYVILDTDQTQPITDETEDRTGELIRTLREQLEAEREANRENRRIIAMLASRVPELEAPNQEPRESPQTATEGEDGTRGPGEAQTPTSRRSWWRRMFGG